MPASIIVRSQLTYIERIDIVVGRLFVEIKCILCFEGVSS
jgi:hypothetical protein